MSDVLDVGDDVLSERTRSGDSGAFAELWRRHARAAQAAARQFQSIADPEDIVSEAYLRILRALQGGGGPREAFRPYLYRTVRNVALSWNEKSPAAEELPEDLVADGPGLEETVLENTVTVRAFRSLPERWQSILWYTEVEGMDPAEAAPYLGLTANSAAALAYRAREGLKKAWLQAHVSDERVPAECRWTTERMGDYRRNALTARANRRFEDHLDTCVRCQIVLEEVDEVGGRLAIMLFPLVLGGTAGAGLLAELSKHATASTPSAAAVPKRGVRSGTIRTVVGVAAGVFGAAAIVTAGFALPTLLQPSATSQVVAEAR
ncbi:MAG TPA: sigma-70 family RNA polymerase sigma factor, partial [Leifsonia sp.]|nr:sigma-70 family RNA polymerase sigma factor [Leifsonia sp.]